MSKPLSTDQKVFNKVARHLLKQNEKSIENGVCLYRGPNGLRCGIGALITNKEYSPKMENNSADIGPVRDLMIKKGYNNMSLLCALQSTHDSLNPSEWRDELNDIAKDYNLKGI